MAASGTTYPKSIAKNDVSSLAIVAHVARGRTMSDAARVRGDVMLTRFRGRVTEGERGTAHRANGDRDTMAQGTLFQAVSCAKLATISIRSVSTKVLQQKLVEARRPTKKSPRVLKRRPRVIEKRSGATVVRKSADRANQLWCPRETHSWFAMSESVVFDNFSCGASPFQRHRMRTRRLRSLPCSRSCGQREPNVTMRSVSVARCSAVATHAFPHQRRRQIAIRLPELPTDTA